MLAESPEVTRCTKVFQRLRYLRRRSGCFRLERPVCRVGLSPTEERCLPRHTDYLRLSRHRAPTV